MRRVVATRYVTPLREGGSLPGLVEADDLGTYVVKFTGAGQGVKALVAEVVAGGIGRALGLRVPELVVVELDPVVAQSEPDWEVQELLARSGGDNLGMDFLPGAIGFDPVAHTVDADEAARVLWFDAFVENVDRSWRNPNLLRWHRDLWCIDHGACLYFHHSWARAAAVVGRAYDASDHVLLPFTTPGARAAADTSLSPLVSRSMLEEVVAEVPDDWLVGGFPSGSGTADFPTAGAAREAYVEHLLARVAERSWAP
ncbi:HipA family kinase [Actinomycetospora chiangmaiensis]|uniref:HipA family kinase n=1 Tax=Actinomycetospora chiangmaiensis TaxID=402650 RepID=UPI0003765507|nr:HipA family kinase [Actinomycetospora chiangmaiensis]